MSILQALRSWRDARGVAFLAAAAFAVGICSATAIYTVVNGVMLKPLPYRDGERFVAIFSAETKDPEHFGSLSFRDAQAYQDRTRVFDAFGWFTSASKNLVFRGEPRHVEAVLVTPSLAQAVGVNPALGRWFQDDSAVVISTSMWRQLGADPAIVGQSLSLDGRSYGVAGVMPESFSLPVSGFLSISAPTDVWIPLDQKSQAVDSAFYFAYARRKPDVAFSAAEADVKRVAAEIAAENPGDHPDYTALVLDLREAVIKFIRPVFLLLLGAAALLFLVTCATVAGLLLARSVARARDTATRIALGASRRELAGQCLAETLPIALAGAAAGIVLSLFLTPAVVSMVAEYVPRADEISVDWSVILFAVGAAVLASVLSSLATLWQALRTTSIEALGDGARTSASTRSRRLSQSLVVGEVALAFALLSASAVLIGHLRNLSRTPSGLNPANVLTFVADIPGSIAENRTARMAFQRRLVDAVQAVPGVDAVAFANQLPLEGCCLGTDIFAEGRAVDNVPAGQRNSLMAVSPDYFRAMGIPLKRGRLLSDADLRDGDQTVALISESAAKQYWGDRDPLGAYGRLDTPTGSRFQVVGIVGDVRNDGLGRPSVPEVYQLGSMRGIDTMNFVVRSARSAASLLPEIRLAVRSVDAELPVHQVSTMRDIIQGSVTLERAASFLTALFAAAALVLATLDVYGIVAYVVRQRRVEIGTRMALGATGGDVIALIVGGGMATAAFGVIVGGAIGAGAAMFLGQVFELGSVGPMPFFAAIAIVGAVTLAASGVPAWRASLYSPMVAIRDQPESMWQAARQRVARAVRTRSDDQPAGVPLSTVIGELADSVRRADSVRGAIDAALPALGITSVMLLEKAGGEYRSRTCAIPAKGVLLNRLAHYPHPLAMPQGHFDTWLKWARELKPDHLPEIDALATTGVQMVVPLRTKNEIVGVLLLGAPSNREQYSIAERQVLSHSGEVIALLLENARLTDRALEQEKVRHDLAMAAEVQRHLLPPAPPKNAAATFAAFTLPARTIGGDYYDFLELEGKDGGRDIGIAVADVSGKGIPAALLMSVVHASLRVISAETKGLPPSELAARMNGFLYQSTGANRYATFFYAQIENHGRRLRYVNAGHNPPYLARRTEIVELGTGGTVIGMFPEVAYEEGQLDLQSGDVLVAFTDGVTEALNPEGEEFGEDRLKDVIRGAIGLPAQDVSTRLAATMKNWIAHAEQHDDLTFVVVVIT